MANTNALDYYAVLGVDRNASSADIKQAYKAAVLIFHPDKASTANTETNDNSNNIGTATTGSSSSSIDFMKIQEAWEVLGDSTKREAYDRECALQACRDDVHVNETVSVCDMNEVVLSDSQEWCYEWPCRCGGQYVVLKSDVEGGGHEVAVPCSTCSLHILVVDQ